jgi:hypothetical protein
MHRSHRNSNQQQDPNRGVNINVTDANAVTNTDAIADADTIADTIADAIADTNADADTGTDADRAFSARSGQSLHRFARQPTAIARCERQRP